MWKRITAYWFGYHVAYSEKEKAAIKEARKRIALAKRNRVSHMDLSDLHDLVILPCSIGDLVGLKRLILGTQERHCRVHILPPEIGGLKSLQFFEARNIGLARLPQEFFQLTALTDLDLRGNHLTEIPEHLGQLKKLVVLYLQNNRLSYLTPAIRQLTRLQALDLSGNRLQGSLPDEMAGLAALMHLDVSNNELTGLPSSLGQLHSLRELMLSRNRITRLPPELGQLPWLQTLDLFSNRVEELPSELFRRGSKLIALNLSNNALTTLPPTIGFCIGLQRLSLANNLLRSLPDGVCRLRRLTSLEVWSNQLTRLPERINRLSQLTRLGLKRNTLEALPAGLESMRSLQALGLRHNPALGLTDEMLGGADDDEGPFDSKPPAEILEAYFSRLRDMPLRELRIVMLFDREVDGTLIARQLTGTTPACRENEAMAEAFWDIVVDNATIRARVCFFPGPGAVHLAQQQRSGSHTLYLIVLEDSAAHPLAVRAAYWQSMVRKCGGNDARMLLIQNNCAHPSAETEAPGAAFIHQVNCQRGLGVPALHDAIVAEIKAMPEVHRLWPQRWLAFKTAVARHLSPLAEPFDLEEMQALFAEFGITQHEAQVDVCERLADLGYLIMHSHDAEQGGQGVTHPGWLMNGAVAVLQHPLPRSQRGVLTREQAEDILSALSCDHRQRWRWVMDWMTQREIVFATEQGWIIPGLLPRPTAQQRVFESVMGNDVRLRCEFRTQWLSPSLMLRVMADRCNIAGSKPKFVMWRFGVSFSWADCTVHVESKLGMGGWIRVTVAGPFSQRRAAMTLTISAIIAAHPPSQRESLDPVVPLLEDPDVSVPYSQLLAMEKAGRPKGVVNNKYVSVAHLLNGLDAGPTHGGITFNAPVGRLVTMIGRKNFYSEMNAAV